MDSDDTNMHKSDSPLPKNKSLVLVLLLLP